MAGDNRFVTEYFLAQNFTPKSGVTPGSNNTLWMDCDQILARYNVSISGVTSTGKRWPSQNQITARSEGSISVSNITSSSAYFSLVWGPSTHGYFIKIGSAVNTHTNPITGEPGDLGVLVDPVYPDQTYATGGFGGNAFTPNTTYYCRSVYQTASGTYYGTETSFTTLP